ncbi:MAG: cytidylate kinase family protein [Desulfuromonadales bacterium]
MGSSNRVAGRLNLETEEAENLMKRQQKARDHFTRDFLNRDDHDPDLYDILLNNDRSNPEKIAQTIAGFVALH